MLAKDTGKGEDFELTPTGLHHAICIMAIDLGHQFHPVYSTEQRKCLLCYELPDLTIDIDGKPMPRVISRIYTLSLNEKAHLRRDLEGWRGRKFTPEELKNGVPLKRLLGVNCQLNIVHNYSEKNQREYANVASVVGLSKGMAKREPAAEMVYFSFDEKMQIPSNIPEWILNMIMGSTEYNSGPGMQNDEPPQEPNFPLPQEEDVPF